MTAIQICALISIIFAAAILYWVGYRGGLIDGRIEGIDEGKANQQSDSSGAIRDLELLLEQAQTHHKQLLAHYKRALDASKLGEPARQTLLDIAEKLRIAAETFSAFRTGKKLERDSLTLRDQALAMAALLDPAAPEMAATEVNNSTTEAQTRRLVIGESPKIKMCPKEAEKAALYFRSTHQDAVAQQKKACGGDV
ncbi:hypothetical protein [Pseudomonas sp. ICMP 460]|uniref:hypothetical protein n=1 Tax=Pseudomonas sp. ICMP 460 TaxID=1718917 RepID=UPI0026C81F42